MPSRLFINNRDKLRLLLNPLEKQQRYECARSNILALIEGETDEIAVLDVDSDFPDIFDVVDQAALELLAEAVSIVYSKKSRH